MAVLESDRQAPARWTVPLGARLTRVPADEHLAERIADGDHEAFTIVYRRYLPALIRYCRGILLVQEDAEDAAQSAMLAALRSLPERPPQLKLRAWLFRVAHNEAISVVRRRHPHDSIELAEDIPSADVADGADTRARVRQLITDLHSIPERQRAALVMREFCGLDYHEIAGALGGSESAAMQTVFEARSALTVCEQGRELSCTGVQRLMSDGDRRSLRARRVRAHLRSCNCCRAFEETLNRRCRDYALLTPIAPIAGKAGLVGLLEVFRFGGHGVAGTRVAGIAARAQTMSPGVRGAAVSCVLVAAGGGVFVHVARQPRHVARKPPVLRAVRPIRGRRELELGSTGTARGAVAQPVHRGRPVLREPTRVAGVERRRPPRQVPRYSRLPQPRPVPLRVIVAVPPAVAAPVAKPPPAPAPAPRPVRAAAAVKVGTTAVGVSATAGASGVTASVSATTTVAGSSASVSADVSITGTVTRLLGAGCLVLCH
jgi:RNA polymerase sigma factor (sigma-70 family)